MKNILIVLTLVGLMGCGYSSRENELIGQVKKVKHQTPLICPDRIDVDVSLGVMKNGVGSMSTQDIWLTVTDKSISDAFTAANASGQPVKITYDVTRIAICNENEIATKVELIK